MVCLCLCLYLCLCRCLCLCTAHMSSNVQWIRSRSNVLVVSYVCLLMHVEHARVLSNWNNNDHDDGDAIDANQFRSSKIERANKHWCECETEGTSVRSQRLIVMKIEHTTNTLGDNAIRFILLDFRHGVCVRMKSFALWKRQRGIAKRQRRWWRCWWSSRAFGRAECMYSIFNNKCANSLYYFIFLFYLWHRTFMPQSKL